MGDQPLVIANEFNPSAHEVLCTEEVHPPQPVNDLRQIAFWLVRCTSLPFMGLDHTGVSSTRRKTEAGTRIRIDLPADSSGAGTDLR